jgi:hypothetical protein
VGGADTVEGVSSVDERKLLEAAEDTIYLPIIGSFPA